MKSILLKLANPLMFISVKLIPTDKKIGTMENIKSTIIAGARNI